MPTDNDRREVARRLREGAGTAPYMNTSDDFAREVFRAAMNESVGDYRAAVDRLADLIEPSYKPDAKYEAWYNSLSHYGDEQGGPHTIRELIEEIVWAALTVDLGPNGNTDPSTGIDEGDVYTNKLFAEWEREALRLSGGIDRDALLALSDGLEYRANELIKAAQHARFSGLGPTMERAKHDAYELRIIARRIREACGAES